MRINDPFVDTNDNGVQDPGETGRYGRAESPDVRFQVDQDNPTILAETGFPVFGSVTVSVAVVAPLYGGVLVRSFHVAPPSVLSSTFVSSASHVQAAPQTRTVVFAGTVSLSAGRAISALICISLKGVSSAPSSRLRQYA